MNNTDLNEDTLEKCNKTDDSSLEDELKVAKSQITQLQHVIKNLKLSVNQERENRCRLERNLTAMQEDLINMRERHADDVYALGRQIVRDRFKDLNEADDYDLSEKQIVVRSILPTVLQCLEEDYINYGDDLNSVRTRATNGKYFNKFPVHVFEGVDVPLILSITRPDPTKLDQECSSPSIEPMPKIISSKILSSALVERPVPKYRAHAGIVDQANIPTGISSPLPLLDLNMQIANYCSPTTSFSHATVSGFVAYKPHRVVSMHRGPRAPFQNPAMQSQHASSAYQSEVNQLTQMPHLQRNSTGCTPPPQSQFSQMQQNCTGSQAPPSPQLSQGAPQTPTPNSSQPAPTEEKKPVHIGTNKNIPGLSRGVNRLMFIKN